MQRVLYRTSFGMSWSKVLYLNQNVPDNYVDETFLECLKKNETNLGNQIKNGAIFLAGGFSVSPILKTLTETISTNTIYTMFALTKLVHLIFYDYGAKAAIVNRHISLNAAIFGAVCLASRLSSSYEAFALLIAASDIFLMSSMLREWISRLGLRTLQITITIILSSVAVIGLAVMTIATYAILFGLCIIATNLICPYVFYKLQKYKSKLQGPWDEAHVCVEPSSLQFNRACSY
ncbi:Phosphatidylinositol N-acetylglucosaminyltransferase subunit C [Fragariocoptes setiger]|uniref:Phosphatidylinositol N-acetylglucosaminyltransferase subunit C n=1 Tax=Fragariocoptes setiger TaxID=1670756 RepID=A0ABQ7S4Z9_9ACAR|nr:Phosphatidylinositol N-acetylglucosaminyltransferase subunit C [Fragariocoptes setiger]